MDFIPLIRRSGRRHRHHSVWLSNEQRSEETRTFDISCCVLFWHRVNISMRSTSTNIAQPCCTYSRSPKSHTSFGFLRLSPCSLPGTIFFMRCFGSSSCNNIPVMRKYSYILRGPVYVLRLYAFQGNDKHAGDEWQNMVVFNLRAYFITRGSLEPSPNQYIVLVLFSQVPAF